MEMNEIKIHDVKHDSHFLKLLNLAYRMQNNGFRYYIFIRIYHHTLLRLIPAFLGPLGGNMNLPSQ